MTTRPPFSQRICSRSPYVLLAAHLSADPVDEEDSASLRADASRDGLCFVRVIRSLEDGIYLVRVAADPDLLTRNQSYTVLLGEEHLVCALPWDSRLQGEPPEHLFRLLCASRAWHQSPRQEEHIASPRSNDLEPTEAPDPFEAGAVSTRRDYEVATQPLPPVFICHSDCQQAIKVVGTLEETVQTNGHRPAHCKTCQFRWLAQMLVQAALIALSTAISKETSVTKGLFEQLHQAILRVSPLLQRCSQQLVHLSETYRGDQQIGWYVQINLPWFLLAA
jgi:hypothetical protein